MVKLGDMKEANAHSGQKNSAVGMNDISGKLSFPLNSTDFM